MFKPPVISERLRRIALVMSVILLVVVTVLLLMPVPDGDGRLPRHVDKLVHFSVFFAVAFPAYVARMRFWPVILVGLVLYGGAVELIQPHFGRSAEFADFIANSLGVMAALPCAVWFRHRRQLKARKPAQGYRPE
ncbi:VanZ family protein [Roseinatronobacter sp. S2]|uniref:VanZ family protein n=1 Tax=Roseinatronobacter sp. S2 TaxID=3035471 RepID=UPI00240F81DE|nr:VanZ family protein [Roseinatronobacter sp. S2]MCC5959697.1 VanZ family protein [Paracoccaceae bacterium]WFE73433.1 VanZ family protein [Roseinatronobacter sp. S2]